MERTNGQKTVNEIFREDMLYIKKRLDQIVDKLDAKADKKEVEQEARNHKKTITFIEQKQDSLTKKLYTIGGIVLAAQFFLAWYK